MLNKLLVTFATLVMCSSVFAHPIERPHISVVGYAEEEVVPDEMLWSVSIENRAAQLESVSEEHARLVKKVLQVIRKQVKDEKDIQTSGMQFGENRVYRDGTNVREGFRANTSINFKLEKIKQYEPLWLALSGFEGVSVTNVSYDYSKTDALRDTVRTKALLAAKAKAQALAETMGASLGEVLVIEEESSTPVSGGPVMEKMSFARADSGSPVSLGTIKIDMRVKLVMALIGKS